jgi:transcriptional regulator with XRE-family HTH domain
VGYRGKVREQEEARRLRAAGRTLQQIADELGVSKSSVSLWVRDVPFTASKRRYGPQARFHPWKERRLREIAECDLRGAERVGQLSEEAFFAAGVALYAGEGSKTDHAVMFANTDERMIRFFCTWLRRFFEVDEARLRVRVYLHEGLDLVAAQRFWAEATGVPLSQFGKPYRAKADPTIRKAKHEHGCCYVSISCSRTHRLIMGAMRALLSSEAIPG